MTRHYTKRRSKEEYDNVMNLYSNGYKIVDIVKLTGISRACISNWVNGRSGTSFKNHNLYGFGSRLGADSDPLEYLKSLNPEISEDLRNNIYSYIFGLYLGDGHIAKYARTKSLTIDMDIKYNMFKCLV